MVFTNPLFVFTVKYVAKETYSLGQASGDLLCVLDDMACSTDCVLWHICPYKSNCDAVCLGVTLSL